MTLRLTDPAPKIWGANLPFWFLALGRLASMFLMITGLVYWADLLGMFGESGLERGIWQEAAMRVILACSFLIASVGVWQLSFWGVVIWVLSAGVQGLAFVLLGDFARMQTTIGILHAIALLLLLSCSGWIYFRAKKQVE